MQLPHSAAVKSVRENRTQAAASQAFLYRGQLETLLICPGQHIEGTLPGCQKWEVKLPPSGADEPSGTLKVGPEQKSSCPWEGTFCWDSILCPKQNSPLNTSHMCLDREAEVWQNRGDVGQRKSLEVSRVLHFYAYLQQNWVLGTSAHQPLQWNAFQ